MANKKRKVNIMARAKLGTIGKDVDDAMEAIEDLNPGLRGVLPKEYAKEKLDKQSLGGLIDLIGTIALGDSVSESKDVLGQVYEYFLGQFALAEGKKGGQFYTPSCVVQLLVEILEPYQGRVFDPCCGSGGMFVQSEKFVNAHSDVYRKQGSAFDNLFDKVVSIYGQESNQTTWRLCKMNLAIRGIDSSNVRWNNEGSFLNDAHQDLKADFADVILRDRCLSALRRINPHLSDVAIESALKALYQVAGTYQVTDNEKFHRYLTDGIPVEYRKKDDV